MAKRILSIDVERIADNDPDTSYLEEDEFMDRLRGYERGAFGYIGIRAKAIVRLNGDLTQTITSGGLWGIEDDSDDDYLKSVAEEEKAALVSELLAMGFTQEQIDKA